MLTNQTTRWWRTCHPGANQRARTGKMGPSLSRWTRGRSTSPSGPAAGHTRWPQPGTDELIFYQTEPNLFLDSNTNLFHLNITFSSNILRPLTVFTLSGSKYSLDLMLIPLPQVTLQPVQAPQEPASHPAFLELDSDSRGKGFFNIVYCAVLCSPV